jgi:pimeloyl-ACP methyl ester carboxylesterase
MQAERRIRQAETRLFARSGLQAEESFVDLSSARVRLRVLSVGTGPPLVMLHGVSLAAAVWAPLLAGLAGYRAHLVELPGHGLSGPAAYRPGAVCSRSGTHQPGRDGSPRWSPSATPGSPCPVPSSGCRCRS